MKQYSITIILSFFYFLSVGQGKSLIIPTDASHDTTYWYKWIQKFTGNKSIADLTTSSDSLHFRISTVSEPVDIWTTDYITFSGEVSAFVKCTNSNKSESFKTFSKPINNSTAGQIYQTLNSNKVFEIPTDNKIAGWNAGFDGMEILIEYSTPTSYSFKEYWTPSLFKDIHEAQTIDTVQRHVWTLINNIKFSDDLLPQRCNYQYSGTREFL